MSSKEYQALWRSRNKEKIKLSNAQWYKDNKEQSKIYAEKFKERNPFYFQDYSSEWKLNNKERANLNNSLRRKRVRNATPKLSELDKLYIAELYDLARRKNLVVDHIIPLIHTDVCGLHTPNNLQLLTNSQNCSKGNTYAVHAEWKT